MELNKTHIGDCMKLSEQLPDNYIDLVVTSPNEQHAIKAVKYSEYLVFTQGPRGGKEYENDTFRLKKKLI